MIKNYMEDVVNQILPNILEKYEGICKCDLCIDDIKTMVLNNLKPHYIVTEKGRLYTKTNELVIQFNTDVIKEIVKATEIVSKNPRHE